MATQASRAGALPAPLAHGPRREDFVGRTLDRLGGRLRKAMAQEESARADGWLQAADARAKVIGVLALVLTATFLRQAALIGVLYAASLLAALSSKVSAGTTLRRVWLTVPMFTAAIAAPAALNLVTPGETLLVLGSLPVDGHIGPWVLPPVLAITRPGLDAAVLIVARVAACVSLAVLLTATTRWQELLGALRSLGVPAAFVMVTEMTYRYFFVLAGLAQDDFLARRSRTIVEPGRRAARGFVAGKAGNLFRRSLRLSTDVNQAMISRGWDGTPRPLAPHRFAAADGVLVGAAVAVALVLLVVDRAAA